MPSKRTVSAKCGGGAAASIPERLHRAHTQLNRLARQLDVAVPPNGFEFAVLGLGQRSRTVFRAIGHLVDRRDAEIAIPTLVRPLVETNVLLRFLAIDPDLHTELWYAEGERNVVTIVDEFSSSRALVGRWARLVSVNIDPAAFASRREAVERVRDKARAAGVPGVGKSGAVLPSITHQQRAIGDVAATEAYTMAYRPLSWDVHGGARMLLNGRIEPQQDGRVTYSDAMDDRRSALGVRALAVSTFASTLVLCGGNLGLSDLESSAAATLADWVPQSSSTLA